MSHFNGKKAKSILRKYKHGINVRNDPALDLPEDKGERKWPSSPAKG
jgi:hypothetical protein